LAGFLKTLAKTVTYSFGLTGYSYYLFRSLQRPEWLYRGRGKTPRRKLEFPPVAIPTPSDLSLCERLIKAYRLTANGGSDSPEKSAIWSGITRRHQQTLVAALEEQNPSTLAKLLSSMFRQEFMYGISTGQLHKDSQTWIGSRIWSLKFFDDLVSLAESLGAVRSECPEQGELGYAFLQGEGVLIEKIESVLGHSVEFPDVGAPYGFRFGSRLITMESPEHLYAAYRIRSAIRTFLPSRMSTRLNIVEIGGGFGGTAYWLFQCSALNISSYVVIDLALTNVLQGYFLAKSLGEKRVAFYGEQAPDIGNSSYLRILPTFSLSVLPERDTDILINQNSMPEIPEPEVTRYLEWARRNLRGIFYSYNQEAYSPVDGVLQVLVPQLVAQIGGFLRLSRTRSWIRRGYVEEIYGPTSAES